MSHFVTFSHSVTLNSKSINPCRGHNPELKCRAYTVNWELTLNNVSNPKQPLFVICTSG